MNTQVQNAFHWRYATKKFNPAKKVSSEDLQVLIDAMRYSPSSAGIQPYKFIVIQDAQVRQALAKVGYNQPQITQASHLIVFARRTDLDEAYVNLIVQNTAKIRDQKVEDLEGYKGLISGTLFHKTAQVRDDWAARQCYLPLGFLLMTAALMQIDACPMEGFDPAGFDQVLDLPSKHLKSTVLCAIGYRADDDAYALLKKARLPESEMVIQL